MQASTYEIVYIFISRSRWRLGVRIMMRARCVRAARWRRRRIRRSRYSWCIESDPDDGSRQTASVHRRSPIWAVVPIAVLVKTVWGFTAIKVRTPFPLNESNQLCDNNNNKTRMEIIHTILGKPSSAVKCRKLLVQYVADVCAIVSSAVVLTEKLHVWTQPFSEAQLKAYRTHGENLFKSPAAIYIMVVSLARSAPPLSVLLAQSVLNSYQI